MDSNALIHPYSVVSRDENSYVRIVSGDGVTLTDDAGNQYIDALASLWLCQIGHGNRTVIDAVNAQMRQLATYNTFEPFSNGPAVEVAEMVRARSQHPDGRVFLGCLRLGGGRHRAEARPPLSDSQRQRRPADHCASNRRLPRRQRRRHQCARRRRLP